VRLIEEISMNAWPALQTILYDGWVLRFAGGYTKRANSVNPLYRSRSDVEPKIRECERLYRAHGLPVVFKMTTAAQPPELDEVLREWGYREVAPTSVQLLEPSASAGRVSPEIAVSETPGEDWLSAFSALNGVSVAHGTVLAQMLRAIAPQAFFAALRDADAVVGCGMGVVERGFAGLFDVVVAPERRGRGLGEELMSNLVALAVQRGAKTVYLQVVLQNLPAVNLYRKLGFREVYRYWYLVGPGPTPTV
jgi:ribosomal protein S18 acetylase RimI-like enzyme